MFKVEGLMTTDPHDNGRLMEWCNDSYLTDAAAVAWRVVSPRGAEVAIYNTPQTARSVRNHLNTPVRE